MVLTLIEEWGKSTSALPWQSPRMLNQFFFFFLIIAKPVCFCSETAMIVGLLFYCPLHAKFTWVCIRPFGFGPLPLGQAFCFITGLNWYWPEKNFSFHYGLFGFLFFFFNRVHFSMIYYLEEISLYLIQTNYN